jgi:DNA-binding beta-propeller fold protein YncE
VRRISGLLFPALAILASSGPATGDGEWLYASEGNRLRRFAIDSIEARPLVEDVLVEQASLDPEAGRDVNGMLCRVPNGGGRFVAGEDTGQPNPPPGWGVFAADGTQVGKLTATYRVEGAEPFGCAFDREGRLFTTEVGNQGFGAAKGQLILWFPPYDHFPGPPGAYPDTTAASANFCKIATDIGTAGGIAIDAEGRVYVASASRLAVLRFSPPFPTSPDAAGGCGSQDPLGSPRADRVRREVFVWARLLRGLLTYSGLAFAPNGNLYAASVFTGRIGEFDPEGERVRLVLDPPERLLPYSTGTPQGLAVDSRGTLYYADLDLVRTGFGVGPGPNGKVWRIAFDGDGEPQPPEIVREHLAFPDGLGVLSGGSSH